MFIIYCIRNKHNGKCYVGQTKKSLSERWQGHCKSSRKNGPKNRFHCALNSYGKDAWVLTILEENIDLQEIANQREIIWIAELHCTSEEHGYNSTCGGNQRQFTPEVLKRIGDASRARRHTEESKKKIRESTQKTWQQKYADGYECTPEHRAKISAANRGKRRTLSEEQKARMREAAKTRKKAPPVTAETRKLLSEVHRKRLATPEARAEHSKKCKKVSDEVMQQIKLKYESGKTLNELAVEYSLSSTQIMRRIVQISDDKSKQKWRW